MDFNKGLGALEDFAEIDMEEEIELIEIPQAKLSVKPLEKTRLSTPVEELECS